MPSNNDCAPYGIGMNSASSFHQKSSNNEDIMGDKDNVGAKDIVDAKDTVIACEDTVDSTVSFWISWRMMVVLIACAGVNLLSVMRHIISMTMVCMVNPTSHAFTDNDTDTVGSKTIDQFGTTAGYSQRNFSLQVDSGHSSDRHWSSTTVDQSPVVCHPSAAVKEDYHHGQFTWSTKEQSYIFAAMAYGQLVTAFPAGIYVDMYSSKRLVFFSFLIGGACTFALPFIAHFGYEFVVILRVIIGLVTGVMWPCLNALIARWAPAAEMGTLYAIVTSGNQLSIVILMPTSAYLCKQRHLFGGWPFAYYLTALFAFLWSILWWLLVTDHPDEHKRISKQELAYISRGRKQRTIFDKNSRKNFRRPYRKIFFSPISLSMVLCLTSGTWGITCLVYYLPTYLRDIMFMDLTSNGESSALPFLSQFFFKLFFSRLADYLKKSTTWNNNHIVKGFNTLGLVSIAVFLYLVTYLNCNQSILAIVLITIATGLYSAVSPGFLAAQLLVAPMHTGLLTAWMNFAAGFSALILPYLVGAVVVESTISEWRIVFAIGSVLQLLGALTFLIWGTAEEQSWARASFFDRNGRHFENGAKNGHNFKNGVTPPSVSHCSTTVDPKCPKVTTLTCSPNGRTANRVTSARLARMTPMDLDRANVQQMDNSDWLDADDSINDLKSEHIDPNESISILSDTISPSRLNPDTSDYDDRHNADDRRSLSPRLNPDSCDRKEVDDHYNEKSAHPVRLNPETCGQDGNDAMYKL